MLEWYSFCVVSDFYGALSARYLESQRMTHPRSRALLKEMAGNPWSLVLEISEYVCVLGMSQPRHHSYR